MIKDIADLQDNIEKVRSAQKIYSTYTQEKVDEIFRSAAMAANNSRIYLAKMAREETGMGVVEDKVIKNHFAAEYIYNKYKDMKTCGIIEEDSVFGLKKIAEPLGIIAGIIPITNPTSTTIFKTMLALKTRNAIIISPHPKAKRSTIEAGRIILEAAIESGAPEDIISWIEEPSIELSNILMQQSDIILATGGTSMVKAAYSSGKPAIGVGAGNTPAIIDETTDVKMAVNSILLSKTFDNGMICASEQSVIVLDSIYERVKNEFKENGAYILDKNEIDKIRKIMLNVDYSVNSSVVGQSAYKIAGIAGVEVPIETKVLIGEVESINVSEPFAHEKLSPILAMYRAANYEKAIMKAEKLIDIGGKGHTSILYTDQVKSRVVIDRFSDRMKTGRILINMPAAQGAIGDLYNFKLEPSLTLGCGSWGGNSISENIGPKHLLNIKSVAERRENMLWFRAPNKTYFKYGSLQIALNELVEMNKKRAFIVTDRELSRLEYPKKVTRTLEKLNIDYRIYDNVEPDPNLSIAREGAKAMLEYKPDVIIALGGGSAIDAAKIMWVMYEHPYIKFKDLAMRFMDIRKRVYRFPKLGKLAEFIAVPTSAGTGSEVTPFAVITDDKSGIKYPIADYELIPNIAIVDAELMMNMPKGLTACSGIDVLVHAIEAYVSIMASDYTNGLALEAIELVFRYLPIAYSEGSNNMEAREKMAHASSIAGLAFSNAFLGLCHSMAHKLGSFHHIPHGMANSLVLIEVIRFNASNKPTKQAAFPQYKYPNALSRYTKIADYLKLGGNNDEEKLELLIKEIKSLQEKIDMPKNIKEAGIKEESFYSTLDDMVEQAFDDQCTLTNPRYPLMTEIKGLYINSYQ